MSNTDYYRNKEYLKPFATDKTEKSGMGLTIVREIVLNHGGSIQIKDADGDSFQVAIDLPMANTGEITIDR